MLKSRQAAALHAAQATFAAMDVYEELKADTGVSLFIADRLQNYTNWFFDLCQQHRLNGEAAYGELLNLSDGWVGIAEFPAWADLHPGIKLALTLYATNVPVLAALVEPPPPADAPTPNPELHETIYKDNDIGKTYNEKEDWAGTGWPRGQLLEEETQPAEPNEGTASAGAEAGSEGGQAIDDGARTAILGGSAQEAQTSAVGTEQGGAAIHQTSPTDVEGAAAQPVEGAERADGGGEQSPQPATLTPAPAEPADETENTDAPETIVHTEEDGTRAEVTDEDEEGDEEADVAAGSGLDEPAVSDKKPSRKRTG